MIDFGADRPVHRQLADLLRADIRSGKLAPGASLPSQARLMQIHGVGQVAVRQALRLLAGEGLIVTEKGREARVAVYDRKPYRVPKGARVVFRMPSPEERRELRDAGGDVPEGVPVAEVHTGPRARRKLVRGDRWEIVFDGDGDGV